MKVTNSNAKDETMNPADYELQSEMNARDDYISELRAELTDWNDGDDLPAPRVERDVRGYAIDPEIREQERADDYAEQIAAEEAYWAREWAKLNPAPF